MYGFSKLIGYVQRYVLVRMSNKMICLQHILVVPDCVGKETIVQTYLSALCKFRLIDEPARVPGV